MPGQKLNHHLRTAGSMFAMNLLGSFRIAVGNRLYHRFVIAIGLYGLGPQAKGHHAQAMRLAEIGIDNLDKSAVAAGLGQQAMKLLIRHSPFFQIVFF